MKIIPTIFLILLLSTILDNAGAQPGGVGGVSIWFKSEHTSKNNYKWLDYGADSLSKLRYDNDVEYTTENGRYINFNPTIYIDGAKELTFFSHHKGFNQSTIFNVFMANSNFSNEVFLYQLHQPHLSNTISLTSDKTFNSGNTLDYGSDYGKDLMYTPPNDTIEQSIIRYKERATRILSYTSYNRSNTSIWGNYLESNFKLSRTMSNFVGFSPEMIVYNRILNKQERQKVESYLALKYGISINTSYLSSWGSIIWDNSINSGYNNRITGIIKDSISGLYQPISTSSNEEVGNQTNPHYTYLHNSYYSSENTNPILVKYALPTDRSLLVIGIGLNSKILNPDKSYMLWGDNDRDLKIRKDKKIVGIQKLNRVWKVASNIQQPDTSQRNIQWQTSQLLTKGNNWHRKIRNTSHYTAGTLVLSKALKGSESGLLGFKDLSNSKYLLLKFGTNQTKTKKGEPDYGIVIYLGSYVYAIDKGEQTSYISYINKTDNFEIIKTEKEILFRKNGKLINRRITIKESDRENDFYATLLVKELFRGGAKIRDFYHKGFVEEGLFLELSYKEGMAEELSPENLQLGNPYYTPYMLIDETGNNDFSNADKVTMIPISSFDKEREKLIFNNLFLDTGQSGGYAFTFGYKQENSPIAFLEIRRPSCNANDTPYSDGIIRAKIKDGVGVFDYTLEGINGTSYNGQTAHTSNREFEINSLLRGDYTLEIEDKSTGITIKDTIYLRAECEPNNGTKTGEEQIPEAMKEIQIYPNPVRVGQTFYVNINNTKKHSTISILNIAGSKIYEKQINKNVKRTSNKIPITLYNQGIYIIKVVNERGGVFTQKIIIN